MFVVIQRSIQNTTGNDNNRIISHIASKTETEKKGET